MEFLTRKQLIQYCRDNKIKKHSRKRNKEIITLIKTTLHKRKVDKKSEKPFFLPNRPWALIMEYCKHMRLPIDIKTYNEWLYECICTFVEFNEKHRDKQHEYLVDILKDRDYQDRLNVNRLDKLTLRRLVHQLISTRRAFRDRRRGYYSYYRNRDCIRPPYHYMNQDDIKNIGITTKIDHGMSDNHFNKFSCWRFDVLPRSNYKLTPKLTKKFNLLWFNFFKDAIFDSIKKSPIIGIKNQLESYVNSGHHVERSLPYQNTIKFYKDNTLYTCLIDSINISDQTLTISWNEDKFNIAANSENITEQIYKNISFLIKKRCSKTETG